MLNDTVAPLYLLTEYASAYICERNNPCLIKHIFQTEKLLGFKHISLLCSLVSALSRWCTMHYVKIYEDIEKEFFQCLILQFTRWLITKMGVRGHFRIKTGLQKQCCFHVLVLPGGMTRHYFPLSFSPWTSSAEGRFGALGEESGCLISAVSRVQDEGFMVSKVHVREKPKPQCMSGRTMLSQIIQFH